MAAISTGLTVVGLFGDYPETIGWIELTNLSHSIGAAWVTADVPQWKKVPAAMLRDVSIRLRLHP